MSVRSGCIFQLEISLTRGSYEAWLQDVFDDPVAPEGEREWYWQREIEVSRPETLVDYVTKMCQEDGRTPCTQQTGRDPHGDPNRL